MKITKWGAGAYFEGENPKAFRPERKSGGKVNYQKKEEETVESVLDSTRILAVPQMDISLDAAKYFKIRSATDLKDGTTVVATYLPYYDKYGKLTGYKKRDWSVPKEKKGHFSVVGTVKASSQFFGQHEAAMGSGKKQIFIVEGEGDVTAGWQAGFEYIKFLHSNPNTSRSVREWASNALKGIKAIQDGEEVSNCPTLPFIGLNCGTANAVDTFAHNEKFIREYEKIVLGLDNDEATAREKEHRIKKGKEATDDVASFLLSDNIYVARYPNERNDPNGVKDIRDIYKKGKWMDIWNMFAKAQDKYVPDKLIGLERISIENLRKKKKDGVPLPCFPRLYELTRGPRTGELWTLTGPSGAGKSTFSRKIEYAIIEYLRNMDIPRLDGWKENEKIAIIRLEEDEEESVNSLYAEELKIDPKAFVADPEQFLTDEQHLAIHQRWIAEDKVKIFDHFGSIPTDQLLQKLKQMVFLDGCRWIILDHLSMVISGLKSDNERRDLDNIMTELAAFCKKYDVFILSISHMKRKEIQIPKDKDGNLLPFWYPVRKEDLRGCLNGYVEFLTPEGWVQLKDYTPGQKVAQWADGEISFTDDVEHIRLECREDMYAFRNSSFEMTVSGEHRVLLDVGGEKQVLTAEEIAKLAKYASFKERSSIVRHYSAGNFQTSLTEWQIRAMVMFAADGCYHSNGLCKMELRKERKIERATKILDKLGVHYSHAVNKRGNTTFRTKALTEKKPLHLCHNWFIEPSHTLKILLDEVFLWDGSDKGDKGREFTSKYREECDVVQHAAHANGMSTKLYSRTVNGVTYYTLSVYREGSCKNKTSLRSLKLEREPSWDGYKYCFKVPSSYFVVRQNGVVFVTGNSAALEQLSWVVLGVEPEELPDRSRGRIRSVVMKNRPHKKLGIADTLIMDDNGQFSDASGWVWEDGMFKLNGEVMLRPKSMIQSLELETPVGKIAVSVPQQEPAVVIEQPEDLDSDSPF
ncbi:DnaB-like helicase C-terminal domain-containing protein [Escherichia coli]|uniref:DnaB-like helicase C-terminal domain-containing protein n=2 Tax=Enterobacteriaceae TaxID=543 RepID=UPI0018E560A6|nr:DnaB-like helicase C-terminal domain-containing protein [Escherichia coli]UDW09778.1 DNA primase/helicase [Escherichia phage 18-1-2]UJQ87269.1 DNA primase/helicase [Escherichia phage 24-2-1]UJQ87441.1 DNA primase/helicase [Escherichia phage 19-1-2]UOX40041.1 DNA primase/helicase [Escherichia phage vB_EcoM_TH18]